jgi:hypothetical protein
VTRTKTSDSDVRGELNSNISNASWQPPPPSVTKINCDAAVNKNEGWIGIGVIARDYQGCFLGVRSFTQKILIDPHGAEAIVALASVMFSKEVSFFDVIF